MQAGLTLQRVLQQQGGFWSPTPSPRNAERVVESLESFAGEGKLLGSQQGAPGAEDAGGKGMPPACPGEVVYSGFIPFPTDLVNV